MRSNITLLLAVFLAMPVLAGEEWGLKGREFMVAADHPLASQVGSNMLSLGGNVVDAAVATSFAIAVVRPYSAGLGGGGFMLVHLRGRYPTVIDYREKAPARSVPGAYLDAEGKVIPGKTLTGDWSVGVPGNVKGLAFVLKKYGTMSWAEVIAPAVKLAETGFPVDKNAHGAMKKLVSRLEKAKDRKRFAEIERIFLKDGKPYAVGEVLRQPDLARTLRTLAKDGPEAFYSGSIARKISTEMGSYGKKFAEDLKNYEVKVREPLLGRFRGYEVLAMPPPSSGGACLLQVLNVLNGYKRRSLGREKYYHVLAEAMKHAFADRAAFLGDSDFHPEVGKDVAEMISTKHAVLIRKAIREKAQDSRHYGKKWLKDDHGTSHYSVIDKDGNAVAATETINYYFGSMLVAKGTGIVLNDELDDFTIKTGVPNEYGLLMSDRNLMNPGQRPLSSMSPTILVKDGRAVLAVGASGGPRIITATLQTILQIIDFGLRPDKAVAAPRIHHQWFPDKLFMEDGFSKKIRRSLKEKGHKISPGSGLGVCQVVWIKGKNIYGASDPRKGGKPSGR